MSLRTIRTIRALDAYQVVRKVHSGAQAVLYKARHRQHNYAVAIKLYDLEQRPKEEYDTEIDAMQRAQSVPGVVRLIDHYADDKWGVVVTEWCAGGCFSDMDMDTAVQYADALAAFLCRTLANLHDLGVVHGDLKGENILRRTVPLSGETFCLCDFGLARSTDLKVGALAGTPDFLAPEVIRGTEADLRIDTWMVGAVLYECVTGETPFFDTNVSVTYKKIVLSEPSYDHAAFRTNLHLRDFVQKCLIKERAVRPRISDLADHPYITEVCPLSSARHAPGKWTLPSPSRGTAPASVPSALPSTAPSARSESGASAPRSESATSSRLRQVLTRVAEEVGATDDSTEDTDRSDTSASSASSDSAVGSVGSVGSERSEEGPPDPRASTPMSLYGA